METYDGIAAQYDLLMQEGYYDYEGQAASLCQLLRPRVLEIGVGSGLLAQNLASYGWEITGVDDTETMIHQARNRLGSHVALHHADVTTMNLGCTFDAVISNGGVWYFVDIGDRWDLYSHIPDLEANRRGLRNVAAHLSRTGVLALSVQGMHRNFSQELPDGTIYTQSVRPYQHGIVKHYQFLRGSEVVGEQTIHFRVFDPDATSELMRQCGFQPHLIRKDHRYGAFARKEGTGARESAARRFTEPAKQGAGAVFSVLQL